MCVLWRTNAALVPRFLKGVPEPLAQQRVWLAWVRLTRRTKWRLHMLGWALTFLVIALIAAALGFGGIAGTSAGIAQILFFIFIVLFVVAMIARALRGKPPV